MKKNTTIANFNTSYVSVKPGVSGKKKPHKNNFNTSYVSVKQMKKAFTEITQAHFNTSYVSVKRMFGTNYSRMAELFQYIICIG